MCDYLTVNLITIRIFYFEIIILLRLPEHEQSKSNPVVEYCRLWRWSDLNNQNELKPVDYCPNAFHYILDNICINPFHYERVPCKQE
jgi:hypothetical protein